MIFSSANAALSARNFHSQCWMISETRPGSPVNLVLSSILTVGVGVEVDILVDRVVDCAGVGGATKALGIF